jgi:phosphatidate cytidylyltransferase
VLRYRSVSFIILWSVILFLVLNELSHLAFAMMLVLSIMGQWECYALVAKKGFKVHKVTGMIAGVCLLVFSYLHLIQWTGEKVIWGQLELAAPVLLILYVSTRQVFTLDIKNSILIIAVTILGFFYVPFLMNYLVKVLFWRFESADGLYLVIYLLFVTKATDVGAYLTGRAFGKHLMIPHVSPKKTWEGLAGGFAFCIGSSVALVHFLPNELHVIQGIHAWILPLILGSIAVIGDLAESVFKRDSETKDSGGVIPGIGGVFDLIDSILFSAPLFYFYLRIVS